MQRIKAGIVEKFVIKSSLVLVISFVQGSSQSQAKFGEMKNQFQLIEIPFPVLLGTQWFLMEIDGNCREINLIRGSHPPERERERDALMH